MEDRQHQAEVAADVSAAWDCELFPLDTHAAVDFILLSRRSTFALAELKARRNPSGQYQTLILSKQKLDAATACAETLKLKFFVFVKWTDGIFWRPVTAADLTKTRVATGGRTDRGDAKDVEPVYHLPVTGFKKLT